MVIIQLVLINLLMLITMDNSEALNSVIKFL